MKEPGFYDDGEYVKRAAWWLDRFGVVETVLWQQRKSYVADMEMHFNMQSQVRREYDKHKEAERRNKG